MAGIRVVSGGMSKEISRNDPKEAALEALRQWAICGQCKLGSVTVVDGDLFFFTTVLLDELGIRYTIQDDDLFLDCVNQGKCLKSACTGESCSSFMPKQQIVGE